MLYVVTEIFAVPAFKQITLPPASTFTTLLSLLFQVILCDPDFSGDNLAISWMESPTSSVIFLTSVMDVGFFMTCTVSEAVNPFFVLTVTVVFDEAKPSN